MCLSAFACFGDQVQLSDIERDPDVHYSIETLHRLMKNHPDHRWRWIMGSDQLVETPEWKDFDQLKSLAPPLVVPRAGYAGGGAADAAGEGPNLPPGEGWGAFARPLRHCLRKKSSRNANDPCLNL